MSVPRLSDFYGIICHMCKTIISFFVFGWAMVAGAVTIHRSFRPVPISTGGGTSTVVPVIGRQRTTGFAPSQQKVEKEKPREKTLRGKVIEVLDGGSFILKPKGGEKSKVILDRIAAPTDGAPFSAQAYEALSTLVLNTDVEVRYSQRSNKGTVVGTVFKKAGKGKGMVDVNLTLVRNVFVRKDPAFKEIPAYVDAEQKAQAAGLGLWAGGN